MKHFRFALRPLLLAVACTSIAACADNPPRRTDPDYRSSPSRTTQSADSTSGSPGQRLTIQSGEGERLNLPWFIRDAQNWINSN